MAHDWKKSLSPKLESSPGEFFPRRYVWRCDKCGAQIIRTLKGMDSIPPSEVTLVIHEKDVAFGTFATPVSLTCEEAVVYKIMAS